MSDRELLEAEQRRERIFLAILSGLYANPNCYAPPDICKPMHEFALDEADEIIAKLDQVKP